LHEARIKAAIPPVTTTALVALPQANPKLITSSTTELVVMGMPPLMVSSSKKENASNHKVEKSCDGEAANK
jgi:hypothetical protein